MSERSLWFRVADAARVSFAAPNTAATYMSLRALP